MTFLLPTIFAFVLAGAVLVAFRFGGRDEKQVALALLVASLATPLVQSSSFGGIQYGILVVDALLLAALIYVALTSKRYWPMFAAGFQMTTIVFHIANNGGAHIIPAAYYDFIVFWSYLVLATLLIGTLAEAAGREHQA